MAYPLLEIASNFNLEGNIEKIEPFGNGHINDTFKISTQEPELPNYILQRKNHHVFKDIHGMMDNIIRVTEHIRKKLAANKINDIGKKVITHIPTQQGKYYFKDSEGNFWTIFLFIPGSQSVEKIENPEHLAVLEAVEPLESLAR